MMLAKDILGPSAGCALTSPGDVDVIESRHHEQGLPIVTLLQREPEQIDPFPRASHAKTALSQGWPSRMLYQPQLLTGCRRSPSSTGQRSPFVRLSRGLGRWCR